MICKNKVLNKIFSVQKGELHCEGILVIIVSGMTKHCLDTEQHSVGPLSLSEYPC